VQNFLFLRNEDVVPTRHVLYPKVWDVRTKAWDVRTKAWDIRTKAWDVHTKAWDVKCLVKKKLFSVYVNVSC